jgi:hypothetical protein
MDKNIIYYFQISQILFHVGHIYLVDDKFQICMKEFIGKFIYVNNYFQISQILFQDGQKYYKLFDKFIKSFFKMNKFLINYF